MHRSWADCPAGKTEDPDDVAMPAANTTLPVLRLTISQWNPLPMLAVRAEIVSGWLATRSLPLWTVPSSAVSVAISTIGVLNDGIFPVSQTQTAPSVWRDIALDPAWEIQSASLS